jgi:hypothetical protein
MIKERAPCEKMLETTFSQGACISNKNLAEAEQEQQVGQTGL